MKKNIFNKLLIFGTFCFLFGCSPDLYEEQIKESKFKVKFVNSEIYKKNKSLINTFRENKTLINLSNSNKIINDTINNISIDTELVKYMEGSAFNSYTFKILNQNEEFLDNLVLMSQPNGNYTPYLLRYFLTKSEIEALDSNENIDFTNKTKVYKITDSNIVSDIFSKIGLEECIMNYTWEEVVTLSVDPNECDCYGLNDVSYSHALVGTLSCTGVNGGGSEIASSPNSGGGGGGVTVITSPCEKVKAPFSKVPALKQKTQTLGTQTSQPVEKGFYMSNNTTSTTINPFINLVGGTNGSIELPTSVSHPISVVAHTHNSPATATYSVPSWEDLDDLSKYIQLNPTFVDTENLVLITITADGTRYALTINYQAFINFFYWPQLDDDNFDLIRAQRKEDFRKEFYYGIPSQKIEPKIKEDGQTNEQNLKSFVYMLQRAGAGVNVFEINSTYSTFTQISYNPNTDQITRVNCK